MAEGADGTWRTLDGRSLYLHAATAGYLYEAHLRHELTAPARRRMGTGPQRHRRCRSGSTRRCGTTSRTAASRSRSTSTRSGSAPPGPPSSPPWPPGKPRRTTLDHGSMRDVWEAKAAEIGWDPASLADALDRVPSSRRRYRPGAAVRRPVERRRGSPNRRRPSIGGTCCGRSATGSQPAPPWPTSRRWPTSSSTDAEVIRLVETEQPGLLSSNVIRRTDGTVVAAAGVGEARWSTAELIGIERHVVDPVHRPSRRRRPASCPARCSPRCMERRPTLGAEQADMVTRLCTSGQRHRRRVRRRRDRQDLHPRRRPRGLGSQRPPSHRRRPGRDRRPGAPIHRRHPVIDAGHAADRSRRPPGPPRRPHRDRDRRSRHGRHPQPRPDPRRRRPGRRQGRAGRRPPPAARDRRRRRPHRPGQTARPDRADREPPPARPVGTRGARGAALRRRRRRVRRLPGQRTGRVSTHRDRRPAHDGGRLVVPPRWPATPSP